jgi:hypothetical protein
MYTTYYLNELKLFSDPSIQLFQSTMKAVGIELQKAHLKTIEHASLQEQIRNQNKRKIGSRRSIHKGGPSAKIGDLRGKEGDQGSGRVGGYAPESQETSFPGN